MIFFQINIHTNYYYYYYYYYYYLLFIIIFTLLHYQNKIQIRFQIIVHTFYIVYDFLSNKHFFLNKILNCEAL
jgi:hypothetical protein